MFDPTKLKQYIPTQEVQNQSTGFSPSGLKQYTPQENIDGKKSSMLGGMVKGLVSAPATMVARPIQLGAELLGAAPEQVNKYNLGGIIAPVPENFKDVKKDVGRAIETVALGVPTAPIAAGAAFGVGSSLEQGNDLFSAETALNAVVGGASGKVLELVGKPLMDATGKVIGTITPKTLKDVASQGAGAVQNFMKQHELLGGIAKPLSEGITKGAEAIDTGIAKGASSLWSGTKKAVSSQYPDIVQKAQKHYEDIEVDRLIEPTKIAGSTFKKSSDVFKNAEKKGIDIRKTLADNKIYAENHIQDGKFVTSDVADALVDDAMSGGKEILRPSLAEAEAGSLRVTLPELRKAMISKIGSTPNSVLSPAQKESMVRNVMKEYADDSITASVYRDGYSLTNLYDSKLQTTGNLYKTPKGGGVQSISDTLKTQQKRIEGDVFGKFLEERAPAELNIGEYMKAQKAKFETANYLRTLDGKNAPKSLFQKALKRSSQLVGATVGAQNFGPFGMFSGYQFGGIMSDTFDKASNPVKVAFLKSIGKTNPEIYSVMKQYVSEKEASRLILKTPLLGSGSKTDIGLQKLKNKLGAIEMGSPENPQPNKLFNNYNLNLQRLSNTKMLPSPEPRIITPNTQGTPNIRRSGDGDVGGMRQRIGAYYKK